jgi:predicted lipoprotein with Yx(FWY)xxD motif
MKRFIPIFVVVAIAALVIAIASGGSSKAHKAAQTGAQAGGNLYGGGQAAVPPPPAAASSAIDLRATKLGKILVDAKGRTLYLFEADRPSMSNCSGACQSLWPPLTANATPQAHGGVLAAKIGTTTGAAKQQVTYDGHPLYYYVTDRAPGQVTCQNVTEYGGTWLVVGPSGAAIR